MNNEILYLKTNTFYINYICSLLCKILNFQPGLKICSRSIHVADDITNIAYNGSKYKDSKKKHTASEYIFLKGEGEKINMLRK